MVTDRWLPTLFDNRRSVDSDPHTCCQWLLGQCSCQPNGPKEAQDGITEVFQPIRQGQSSPSYIEVFSEAIVATSDHGITGHALLRSFVTCSGVSRCSALCPIWNSCTRADRGSRPWAAVAEGDPWFGRVRPQAALMLFSPGCCDQWGCEQRSRTAMLLSPTEQSEVGIPSLHSTHCIWARMNGAMQSNHSSRRKAAGRPAKPAWLCSQITENGWCTCGRLFLFLKPIVVFYRYTGRKPREHHLSGVL
jgi:hypothetical protein